MPPTNLHPQLLLLPLALLSALGSYNASGDYSFGGGGNHQWDDGIILHGEDHQTELWNPNAPYTSSPAGPSASSTTK